MADELRGMALVIFIVSAFLFAGYQSSYKKELREQCKELARPYAEYKLNGEECTYHDGETWRYVEDK